MSSILIAGASGALGRALLDALEPGCCSLRLLSRSGSSAFTRAPRTVHTVIKADLTRPTTLRGICDGVETVFSSAGASMRLGGVGDRRSFRAIDWEGNLALLREAQRAGVRRFVYVSVFGAEALRRTEYADAHHRMADAVRLSGLENAIIQPTGFFAFLGEIFRQAQRGVALLMGDGSARTNPVHEGDVARLCRQAILGECSGDQPIGGPDVLSRREITELALEVAGRNSRLRSVPPALLRAGTAPLRVVNRRLHALMQFGIAVSQVDAIAPPVGRARLRDYFLTLRDH